METPSDHPIDLIPAAFHILWGAALSDKARYNRDSTLLDDFTLPADAISPKSRSSSTTAPVFERSLQGHRPRSASDCSDSSSASTPSPRRPDPTIRVRRNHDAELTRQQSVELSLEMMTLYARETAAVCVIECDRGETLVKKSFHDVNSRGKFGHRARTEDFLLNWLGSDLTCQHARTVDVALYLSCPLQSTTSDGLRLWLDNLRELGKSVSLQVKLASLGCLHKSNQSTDLNSMDEELEVKDDIVDGMRRLREGQNVTVKPIAPQEWPELLSLLANKMALRGLEDSHNQATNQLQALLEENQ